MLHKLYLYLVDKLFDLLHNKYSNGRFIHASTTIPSILVYTISRGMIINEEARKTRLRLTYKRTPDVAIGGFEDPYLYRWYVIPRNPIFNIYFHKFIRSDDDRALHDHPWWSISLLLHGDYLEVLPDIGNGVEVLRFAKRGDLIFRKAKDMHRISLINNKPCYTLFITGPRFREWGFAFGPTGWTHHTEFEEVWSAHRPNLAVQHST